MLFLNIFKNNLLKHLTFLKIVVECYCNGIHRRLNTIFITYFSAVENGVSIMAYIIDKDTCIDCGACAENCPVGAISENDGVYEIDADTCLDCGACEGTCPVGAPKQA